MSQTSRYSLFPLACAFACLLLPSNKAAAQEAEDSFAQATTLSALLDVSRALCPGYPETLVEWQRFPTPAEIALRQPMNRSVLKNGRWEVWPPRRAAAMAGSWIMRVVHPDWHPPEISPWLVLLQMEDGSRSCILTRYEKDGYVFHMAQSQLFFTLTIRAPQALPEDPVEAITEILLRFTAMPEEAMEQSVTERVLSEDGIEWFYTGVDRDKWDYDNSAWWQGINWCRDDRNVHLLKCKFSFDNPHIYTEADSWF